MRLLLSRYLNDVSIDSGLTEKIQNFSKGTGTISTTIDSGNDLDTYKIMMYMVNELVYTHMKVDVSGQVVLCDKKDEE